MSTQGWKKTDAAGIYRRGERLRIRVTIYNPTKLERQRTLPKGINLEEAKEKRRKLRRAMRKEAQRICSAEDEVPNFTVSSYAKRWIEMKAKRCKPSTVDRYRRELSEHILPEIGEMRLEEVTRRHVAAWVAKVENKTKENDEKYSTPTVDSWWRTLRALLRDGAAEGHLDKDPTERINPPNTGVSGRRESRTLSGKELAELIETFRDAFPRRYPEAVVLAHTGIRPGEMYALEWDDVELPSRKLHVHRAHWRGEVGTTKTDDRREVPLSETAAEALKSQRERLIREQHPGLERGLVFPAETGGYRTAGSIRDRLREAANAAGLDVKVGPQVLRRTLNTLALKSGIDRIHLRSIIGHSSEQMTERYAGISLEDKRAAVDQIFGEKGGEPVT